MALWFSIIGGMLVLGLIYLGWRLRQQQRGIIDFQLTYHKTMTPAQIQHSRRFFFQTEIKKSSVYRRLHMGVQVGRWGSYGLLALIVVQQIGLWQPDDQPVMATLCWLGLLVTLTGRNLCQWQLNRQLYASVQIAQTPAHVDLMMTPMHFTQSFLRLQLWSIGTLATLMLTLAVASGTETLPDDYLGGLLDGLGWQSTSSRVMPRVSSSSSQESDTDDDDAQDDAEQTTTRSSESQTKVKKVYTSAAYVRSLPVKSQRYLTRQDRVGLISMYYLVLNHYDYNGIANNPTVKYVYHVVKNIKPLTIVVTSTEAKRKFYYLTQIDKQNYVRVYRFKNQTPSAFHGLVPAYQEYPKSKVKMGQLIKAYYSDQDGSYHRTMWAMEPGTDWTY